MDKTISIAIATYNGSRFLEKQLNSLYSQTKLPDEVVVSDDGSDDGTLDILEDYSKKYGLIYSVNPGPHGVNNNFYRAISLCTKDYIAICDQDDIWLPEKVMRTYTKLVEIDNGKPCAVSSLCDHIDSNDNVIKSSPYGKDDGDYAATLLDQGRSQGCSLMINRELWDYVSNKIIVDARIDSIYDAVISYTAAIVGTKYNLGDRLMLYRHHDSNVIAKDGVKKSYWQRLIDHEYYYLPYNRFRKFEIFYEICKDDISNPKIEIFLKRVVKIGKENRFKGFCDIFQMPELSVFKKTEIVLFTICMDLVKLFAKKKSKS